MFRNEFFVAKFEYLHENILEGDYTTTPIDALKFGDDESDNMSALLD